MLFIVSAHGIVIHGYYICSDKSALQDLSTLDTPILVNLPNGTQVQVRQQGKLLISQDLVLEHVLLIPNFRFNLVSVKRLCKQLQCTVQFTESLCMIHAYFLKKPV